MERFEPSGRPSRERLPALDGLRGLAFLAVFANHGYRLPMGWVGVDLFFVLSGFLITGVLLDAKGKPAGEFFGGFYLRRARRILPPYFLVLAIVAIVGHNGVNWRGTWVFFFTMTQNIAEALQRGLGSLFPTWSLAVEEQFYIVWPFLCFALARRHMAYVSVALLILAPVLRALVTPYASTYTVIFCLTPFRMDLLAAGALLAIGWRTREAAIRSTRNWLWLVTAFAAIAFVAPALFIPAWRASANSEIFNTVAYSVSALLWTSVVAQALTTPPGSPLARSLGAAPLAALGRISYTCYLIHFPAVYLMRNVSGQYSTPIATVLMTGVLAFTIAFAWASWALMEAPILGAPRRLRNASVRSAA